MITHARAHVAAQESSTGAEQYSERSRNADPSSFMEFNICASSRIEFKDPNLLIFCISYFVFTAASSTEHILDFF